MKTVSFLGSSLKAVRDFPDGPRREAGFQIDRVQRGLDPDHWKPMKTIGPGVREIRISEGGAFRVVYTAAFVDTVYVLHAFQKKRRRHRRAIWIWQPRGMQNWCGGLDEGKEIRERLGRD